MTEATLVTDAAPRAAARTPARRDRAGGAGVRRAMVAPTVLATLVLGAIAPPVLQQVGSEGGDTAAFEAAALALLRGAATGRA